ncbi:MAG: family 78 glycoside hydrolase catalytic domain, partial [Alistipes sp.]|nr:family 78 glycoside hydrolase catalytic domain [Alistipes sp.]
QVEYAGRPLKAFDRCYWRVQVWDKAGTPKWSAPSQWSMGPMELADWGAARWVAYKPESLWISEWQAHKQQEAQCAESTWPWKNGMGRTLWELYDQAKPHYDASPLFRKEFTTERKVTSAMLYVCGLGYYEAYLNGKRVGDHVLDPAWTVFDKRSFYVTHDVTRLMTKGENVLGLMIGRGQYNPLTNDIWGLSVSKWVGEPRAIALLRIRYSDGTTKEVATDGSWQCVEGPIRYDDTRQGEIYDARYDYEGWTTPRYDASSWGKVSEVSAGGPLRAQMMPPVRCFAPIAPVKRFDKGAGRTVYDLGINISGWARVRLVGPKGAKVLVEYCELPGDREVVPNIHPSKLEIAVPDSNYASFYDCGVKVRQQNGYILKGEGQFEVFECHFSYKGFQYVRVTADPGVRIAAIEGVPVHTDVEDAGRFICSNETINRLQAISRWTLLNNFHSIPTDCPHREKQGWTADAYMTAPTAIYNFDMAAFYTKWLEDLVGTQGDHGGLCTVAPSTAYDLGSSTVWPAALLFVTRDMQLFYDDRQVAQRNLASMRRFVEYCAQLQLPGKPYILREVLGDWVAPIMELQPNLVSFIIPPPEGLSLYGTASYYRSVRLLEGMERSLGNTTQAQQMAELAEKIAEAFHREYFDPQTHTYHGDHPTAYRQAANIVPLEYGMTPEAERTAVTENFCKSLDETRDRVGTGFIGTMAMMDLLPEIDPERAFRVATQPEYPGWGYMVADGTATTMWENWDGGNSRNHPPFCLISGYFYKYLAGIRPLDTDPGFKRFLIAPSIVGDLTFADGWHDSPYGRIRSTWSRSGDQLTLCVTVPVNSTAVVVLPTDDPASVTESGLPVTGDLVQLLQHEQGKTSYQVVSGEYSFQCKLP